MIKLRFIICTIAILIVHTACSQSTIRELSLRFKSDSTSKAVLLSNIMPDAVGNEPPYIGSAYWTDSSRLMECRSLLSFDINSLLLLIKPEQLTKATLILEPVQPASLSQTHTNKFIVRRVTEPWEETETTWNSQPAYSTYDEVIKKVPVDKADQTVKVNVTNIVKNMIRYGNNGFLLCFPEWEEVTVTASKWFGSGRNENKAFRPVLQLDFFVLRASNVYFPTSPLIEVYERQQRQVRPETTPTKEGQGGKTEPAVNN